MESVPTYFPSCWSDDERMDALFAEIRSSSTNPADYPAKIKFWTDLVREVCERERLLILDYTVLCEKFRRKGRIPQSLTAVIQELLR